MSKRTASWIVWSMCALSLALTALSLYLLVLNLSNPDVPTHTFWEVNTVIAIGFTPVGALIVSRSSPKNSIGWLFCATGLSFAMVHFSAQYVRYALLAAPGSLPAGEAAAWIYSWAWVPALGLTVYSLLLFPDGRLPSHRWRWFFWLSLLLIFVGTISQAFASGSLADTGVIYNPLGVEGLPNTFKLFQTLMFTLMFISAASLFVRRLRARGIERQQLMWFTYTATLAISGSILAYTLSEAMGSAWLEWVGYVLTLVGLIGTPISMGIAILRYRLYEIDLIINRTLVYGALTATLAVVYFVDIVVFQEFFRALTGQTSQLAVVASTLMIAALFSPLRRRLQAFIVRRFYRRKYDARKVLEAFGSRLREQTDLEKLSEDLAEVVDETMQPAHLSVILRSEVPSSTTTTTTTTTTKEQGQQEDQQTTRHEED